MRVTTGQQLQSLTDSHKLYTSPNLDNSSRQDSEGKSRSDSAVHWHLADIATEEELMNTESRGIQNLEE